jgi:osmotically-inducible protein OsmY
MTLRTRSEQGTDHYELLPERDPASLVASRLRRSGYPFLRGIKCEVRDDITVLSGSVPTFHLKQVAQEIAAHTQGVRLIENRVHVTNSPYRFTAAG